MDTIEHLVVIMIFGMAIFIIMGIIPQRILTILKQIYMMRVQESSFGRPSPKVTIQALWIVFYQVTKKQ
ncbi:MAG TPA: hypothetical protein DF610_19575 [Sphingobacterium sp.]|nr:hypothetical protein [Sphingobacterium sp.]